MGIDAKHAYRFGFLKSEEWSSMRLWALRRDACHCVICGVESFFNDVHHLRYRKGGWKETRLSDLRTLCRNCHELVHAEMKRRPFVDPRMLVAALKSDRQTFHRMTHRFARDKQFVVGYSVVEKHRLFKAIKRLRKKTWKNWVSPMPKNKLTAFLARVIHIQLRYRSSAIAVG